MFLPKIREKSLVIAVYKLPYFHEYMMLTDTI